MIIAAYISAKNNTGSPLLSSLLLLAKKNTADTFIIISEDVQRFSEEHIISLRGVPDARNGIFKQYWYNFVLPALLKKHRADLFISDKGILSNKAALPQYLFFNDHFFGFERGYFFKRNFTGSLSRAKRIFTAEDFIGPMLSRKNPAAAEKIQPVYHGLPANREAMVPADIIKQKFTEGFDYFLFPADLSSAEHGTSLLKAFSRLKKRLKSSMKLVLLLRDISGEELIPDLKNYRYRDDVLLISAEEKNAHMLILHAYGLIFLSTYTAGNEAFSAMQNHVPVITEENDINKSLFGNAVLYASASDDDLGEKMQLLYKDEFLRSTLTAAGTALLEKYDEGNAAEALYRGITEK